MTAENDYNKKLSKDELCELLLSQGMTDLLALLKYCHTDVFTEQQKAVLFEKIMDAVDYLPQGVFWQLGVTVGYYELKNNPPLPLDLSPKISNIVKGSEAIK